MSWPKQLRSAALILLLALLVALLAGCQSPNAEPQPADQPPTVAESFVFTAENYPKMGGSLAALPLGEAITAAALGIEREASAAYIRFENSTTWNYQALVDGEFEILLAYEPSAEAILYAREQGFEWEMTAIGRDALVFIVNAENPLDQLSSEQIKNIYRGKITNWQEVGGPDSLIIPYQRNPDSGSQTLFDLLLNLGNELMEAPSERIIGSMIGLLEVIADYDNDVDALGYTVYYYLTNMNSDKLEQSKILAVDGVAPSNQTIADGSYPYTNDFYVVIPADLAADDPARILYNWICSEQVKELGERENYVMVN